MRLRYWTAITVFICVAFVWKNQTNNTAPEANVFVDSTTQSPLPERSDNARGKDLLASEFWEAEVEASLDSTPLIEEVTFSRAVGPGESLYAILAEAGLDAATRRQVSAAFGSEYDLQLLKPGHKIDIAVDTNGVPQSATLEVENGVRIHAVFGAEPSVRAVPPELDTVHRAGEAWIGSSIYASLESADIPTRFATDLELVFAGTLDLRRILAGGERLQVVWREYHLDNHMIGDPTIDYAVLNLGSETYEILWPQDGSITTRIYKDEQLLLFFEQPIKGARLSSAFGPRSHPVHGNLRMHSGVDFAAEEGAAVHAIRPGRVAFSGQRGGYGLMVEIDHAKGIRTLYAHLSSVKQTLEVGQRVVAGDRIARVGSTGTSTAPHLHYEVIVDGDPVPPLTDARLYTLYDHMPGQRDDSTSIIHARTKLLQILAKSNADATRSSQ